MHRIRHLPVVALLWAALAGPHARADGPPAPPVAPTPASPPPAPAAPVPPAPPTAPTAPKGPHGTVAFDREAHDFGVARQEQELRTTFSMRNTGDAPLHVTDVRADCGCAAATLDDRELAPGATGKIQVALRTLTMSGTLHKRIRVLTDDPARPMVELQLVVDVAAGIVLDPARFFWGDVLAGTTPSVSMRIKWKDGIGKAFHLTAVEAPNVDVSFERKPFDEPPWHGYEVTASFTKPPKVGTFSGTALLRTDDPDYPRLTAAIQAFVSGKVWLDRRAVSLGMVPAGKGREVAVHCRPFKKNVDLGDVTAASRKGAVVAKAVRAGPDWIVTIELPAAAPAGKVEDVVEVRSTLADEPPAEIAVSGYVSGAK